MRVLTAILALGLILPLPVRADDGKTREAVLAASEASAPPAKPQDGLSLMQLVQFALARNPQTRLAWAQAREAVADVGIARSYYYPEVTLSGELTTSYQHMPDYPGTDIVQKYIEGGPGADIYYLLLDFGGRDAYVAMMREQLTAAKFNRNQVMQDVILEVQSAYYTAMAGEAQVALARTQLQYAETNFQSQQQALEAGLGIPAQLLRAESDLQAARSDLQAAQSNLAAAYGQVNVACGAPANAPLRLAPMPRLGNPAAFEKNVNTLITGAYANRPDMAEQLALVRAKEDSVRRVQSTYWPTVSLQGDWYYRWFRARENPQGTGTLYENNHDHFAGVGVVIEWDAFDGFRRDYKVKAAKAEVEQQAAVLQQTKLDVSQQVWQAYYGYLTAGRTLAYRRAGLLAAESQFAIVREGFVTGLSDLLDFYQAEVLVAQARADLATAQSQWYTASATLIYATGRLTPGALPRSSGP